MEFFNLIKERYSVREYKDKEIPVELLEKVLDAGRIAPTARNCQPVRILVAKSKEVMAKMNELTPCVYGAPIVLIICSDTNESSGQPNGRSFAEADASIAATHIMLAAADVGLGTVWVGRFDQDEVRKALSFPDELMPFALMPIGYPADTSVPNPRHTDNKELSEIVKYI
ncbi:MAG: nitroreductase family protein [Clostridia bacterium]|nr:nitroreductase family protein [Clostridia bacterium]